MIDNFILEIKEYTNNYDFWGFVRLGIDIILVSVLIFGFYKFLRIKLHQKKILLVFLFLLLFYGILYVIQLTITLNVINFLIFWSVGVVVIVYTQDIKHFIDNTFQSTRNENTFSSEEEKYEVINILVNVAVYLSKRRIGALITIERDDSLNSFIEKAIIIKAAISEELLTSIFTVGTATHDGAVIIRRNKIMCAGAYLPSTDKYDVPKALGTRHRAAIGISERYDAITVVISEETGNISVTSDGVIDIGLSEEKLRETLEHFLIVK